MIFGHSGRSYDMPLIRWGGTREWAGGPIIDRLFATLQL